MPHAVIVGAGNMGTAIAYGMSKLGYDITIIESRPTQIDRIAKLAEQGRINLQGWCSAPNASCKADVMISAATYLANPSMALFAIQNKIPYCDLGGDPDTSKHIQEIAGECGGVVFTDLGLAPGLVNILAEHLVQNRGAVNKVVMRVGGLPFHELDNSLNYGLTWSSEGLRNEYSGDCIILRNGEEMDIPALSEIDSVEFRGVGTLESFHTKGGSAHSIPTLRQFGVQNVEYKTMRFPGHGKLINFLLNECRLEPDVFDEALRNVCPVIKDDQILLDVEIDGQSVKQLRIIHDEWTAMQKATAFPTAAVASLMADGLLPPPVLGYLDIPLEKMDEQLQKIGGFPSIL